MKTTLLILALLCLLLQGCQSTQAPLLANSITAPQAKANTDKNKTTAEELQFLKTAQFWPAGRTEDILERALREGLIYNGMTLEAATELLGPYASIDKDTVRWYRNPNHKWHVAGMATAKIRNGSLFDWKFTRG